VETASTNDEMSIFKYILLICIVQIKLLKVLLPSYGGNSFGEIIILLLIVAFLAPIVNSTRYMHDALSVGAVYIPVNIYFLGKHAYAFLAHFTTVVVNMHIDLHAIISVPSLLNHFLNYPAKLLYLRLHSRTRSAWIYI